MRLAIFFDAVHVVQERLPIILQFGLLPMRLAGSRQEDGMWRMWGRWRALATAVADSLRVNLAARIAE